MSNPVKIAFEQRIILLPVGAILPLKKVPAAIKESRKYARIAQSVAEIGIIEPLMVAAAKDDNGCFLLLDGHTRLIALQDLGATEVRCLIADDDEAFTYNKRVNRLATVQEHYMIVRAIESGVSEEKLARALNVDTKLIQRRKTLLDGISPEVVELLKDKSVNPQTFEILKKMRSLRQIEAAELMCSVGNFSSAYAKALLAGTRQSDLARPDKPKKIGGITPEQMARMEREMSALTQDFKALEASYGDDVLHLVIASGYLNRLLANPEIERYLTLHHAEILSEFRSIVAATSLDQASTMAA